MDGTDAVQPELRRIYRNDDEGVSGRTSKYGRRYLPVVRFDPSLNATISLLQSPRTLCCVEESRQANITVADALSSEQAQGWKAAMQAEMDGLKRLHSWDLTARSSEAKIW